MRIVIWIVVGLVAVVEPARAQPAEEPPSLGLEPLDSVDLPFDHAELRLTARGTSADSFGDAGGYRDGSVALAGALPLYAGLTVPGTKLDRLRVLAQFRFEGEGVDSAMLGGNHDQAITKAALGASLLYLSDRLDLYALYASASIAESRATLADPTVMPTVLGLGSYRSGSLTWLYGGGFGYAAGRSWLLPAAGVAWRASDAWTLSVLLPVYADAKYRITKALAMSLVLSVSGDLYGIANDGAFAGASSTLQVRLEQLRLGLKASYKLDPKWTLRAEVGAIGPRRLEITDNDAIMMSASSHGAAYLATGVSYAFGH